MKIKNSSYSDLYYGIMPSKIFKFIETESILIQAYIYKNQPFWFRFYFLRKKKFTKNSLVNFKDIVQSIKDEERILEIVQNFILRELS